MYSQDISSPSHQENDELNNSTSSNEASSLILSTVASEDSWRSKHFTIVEIGEVKKRKCLSEGCNTTYAISCSQNILTNHWRKNHGYELQSTNYFSHDIYIENLIRLILDSSLEYSIVERKTFRDFVNVCSERRADISRKTISSCLIQRADSLKEKIVRKLELINSVSLTTDCWSSSNRTRCYCCVTCHFVEKGALQSIIIEFKYLPYPHDANVICNFLSETIRDFDIAKKIVAITSDNGSNIVSAIEKLRLDLDLDQNFTFNFLHFRCVAHVIHLCACQITKHLDQYIKDAQQFVDTIKSSTKRIEKFDEIQQNLISMQLLKIEKPLKVISAVKTRWNSTFYMIQRLLLLRPAVEEAMIVLPELRNNPGFIWKKLETLVTLFTPFTTITDWLSGSRFVTISLVRATIPRLIKHLESDFHDDEINEAALSGKEKLERYNEHLNSNIIYISHVLDPRLKTQDLNSETVSLVKKFISEYIEPNEPSTSKNSILDDIFLPKAENEIDFYLQLPREPSEVNPLTYWKKNKSFPQLAELSEKIHIIQATSVASERAFSAAGQIDTDRRNRLSAKSFRCNMLLNSWVKYLESVK